MSDTWIRLSVDVDLTGMAIGISSERHVDGERVGLSVYDVGPAESPDAAFERCRLAAEAKYGVQLLLWP